MLDAPPAPFQPIWKTEQGCLAPSLCVGVSQRRPCAPPVFRYAEYQVNLPLGTLAGESWYPVGCGDMGSSHSP